MGEKGARGITLSKIYPHTVGNFSHGNEAKIMVTQMHIKEYSSTYVSIIMWSAWLTAQYRLLNITVSQPDSRVY